MYVQRVTSIALAVSLLSASITFAADAQEADIGLPAEPAPGVEISTQPPRDLKDIALAAKPTLAERRPSVAANPADPRRLTISFATGDGRCVVRRSSDAGRTWSAPVALPQPVSSAASCYYADLAYAPDGERLFAAYTASATLLVASHSDDDGKTWQQPVVVLDGTDDEFYIVQPALATPLQAADRDFVYLTVRGHYIDPGLYILFARSTDGGETWGGLRGIAAGDGVNSVVGGQVAGGNGSEVLISWYETYLEGLSVARSPNHGGSFDPPVRVATDGYPPTDVKIGPGGVAHLVYERRSRRPMKDSTDIGYTWSAGPPYTTWERPVTISDPGVLATQRQTSLAVTPCGRNAVLHVIWWDERASTASAPPRPADIYYARKLARPGSAWSPNLRISNRSSLDGAYSSDKQPDIAGGAGRLFAVWTDRRDKTDPNDYETDVYGSPILSGISCP